MAHNNKEIVETVRSYPVLYYKENAGFHRKYIKKNTQNAVALELGLEDGQYSENINY